MVIKTKVNIKGDSYKDKYLALEQLYLSTKSKLNEQENLLKLQQVSNRMKSAPKKENKPREVPLNSKKKDMSLQSIPYEAAMIYGIENTQVLKVQAETLIDVNNELRKQLNEADNVLARQKAQIRLLTNELQQLKSSFKDKSWSEQTSLRDRDILKSKLNISESTVDTLKKDIKILTEQLEKQKLVFECTVNEVSSKLDKCSQENQEIYASYKQLEGQYKESQLDYVQLKGTLHDYDYNLSAQKEINVEMISKLETLTLQLKEERVKSQKLTREYNLIAVSQVEQTVLKNELRTLINDKAAIERENLDLIGDVNQAQAIAANISTCKLKETVGQLEQQAKHWEMAALLLFKDLSERAKAHHKIKEHWNSAQQQRDEASLGLQRAKRELEYCYAKLNISWPNHFKDTENMPIDNYHTAFLNMKQYTTPQYVQSQGVLNGHLPNNCAQSMDGKTVNELKEYIRELTQLNLILKADNKRLLMANQAISIEAGNKITVEESLKLKEDMKVLALKNKRGSKECTSYKERIDFLERQIKSLRGTRIDSDLSISELGSNQTIVEMYVPQIIVDPVFISEHSRSKFLISLRFLTHETITFPVVTGSLCLPERLFSFQIEMDAVLDYALRHQGISATLTTIQENATSKPMTAHGITTLGYFLNSEKLLGNQPSYATQIVLFSQENTDMKVAAIEVEIRFRRPFSPEFISRIQKSNTQDTNSSIQRDSNELSISSNYCNTSKAHYTVNSSICSMNSFLKSEYLSTLKKHSVFYLIIEQIYLEESPTQPLIYCLFGTNDCWLDHSSISVQDHTLTINKGIVIDCSKVASWLHMLNQTLIITLWNDASDDKVEYDGIALINLKFLVEQELLKQTLQMELHDLNSDKIGELTLLIRFSEK